MRIAINALAVDGGGGQTYLENLLPELNRVDRENEYVILLRRNHNVNLSPLGDRFKIVLFGIPRPFLIGRFFIEQLILPRWLKKNKIDLLYSPADATTLLAPCPVVLAMRNPNLYIPNDIGWPIRFKLKFYALGRLAKWSTSKARQIIFVSHASEKLVKNSIAISPEKTNVVHHGVSSCFFQENLPGPKAAASLRGKEPYILSVSSIYRYKNYIRLIEAFAAIRKNLTKNYHLLIVGSNFDNEYFQRMHLRINELQLQDYVHYIGGFPLHELPPIYRRAELFAFPSVLETFGHTLVEAMASGLPIIAGDIEPTREIAGGAARYFDPFQVNSIAQVMLETLSDENLRASLIANGKKQVSRFSWERCARETLNVFNKTMYAQRGARR